ncbi:MAG: hypothetical protein R3F62_14365 [Planctomycetota bacterium]
MNHRLSLALLLGALACTPEPSPEPAAARAEESAPLTPIADYAGWAFVSSPSGPSAFAIRDAEAFEAFLARIPDTVPSKRRPAPPNDDALRAAGAPDFAQHMLVVSVRESMYVGPRVARLERTDPGLEVTVEHPPLGDTIHAAAILELGRYHAVLVPRVDGPLASEVVEVPE